MIKLYNKLVRDNVPSIIEASGKKCRTEIMDEEQYMTKLVEKLHEELGEFETQFDAFNDEEAIKELADLTDVIMAIISSIGVSDEAFERIRNAKKTLNGGFDNKILLLEVTD